jgi:glycosyltransferase involved in cell wall biosynthesis
MREKLQFTSSYHTNYDRYADTYVAKLSETVIALLRRFHAPAATTMVATPSLMTLLEKRKFKNLSLWPLGVDTELFRPRKNPPIAELKKPVFTLFGRLAKDKNPDEFFNLDLPGTKLVIGDGPERTRLEKKFVAHATFVGFKKSDELVRWLSLSDVLVFPSTNETFGLTIIEALACGVPVAAHDVMGPKDIITNGVDGILSEDLKEAALACLSIDKALPREKALRYSWDESVSAFLRLLTPVRGND